MLPLHREPAVFVAIEVIPTSSLPILTAEESLADLRNTRQFLRQTAMDRLRPSTREHQR